MPIILVKRDSKPERVSGVKKMIRRDVFSREVRSGCAAMPAGATTSILGEKYHMEPEFCTKLVIFSTLLSLPSIALWGFLLQLI